MITKQDNQIKAQLLRQLADYVEQSTSPARVRLSLDVTVVGHKLHYPSKPLEEIAIQLASFAAGQIAEVARQFQRVNPGEGEDIVTQFTNLKTELDNYVWKK